QRIVLLQPSKLALDGGAATVEPLPLVRAVGDRAEWTVEPVLLQRDDWDAAALADIVVDAVVVVPHVHRARDGREAAIANGVQQRSRVVGLMAPGRLDPPRERQAGPGSKAAAPPVPCG